MPTDQEYLPLPVETLRLDQSTTFSLYMQRGSEDNYVLYRGKDLPFTSESLDSLQRNKVKTLWVPAEEWDEYQKYLEENLDDVVDDDSVPEDTKCEVVYGASSHMMETAFDDTPGEDIVDITERIVRPMTKMMLRTDLATQRFMQLAESDYRLYTHSVNVCILGMALAKIVLKATHRDLMYKYGPGFLLHDIGKRKLPREIMERRGALTHEEWELMKQHPLLAFEVLGEVELPEETRQIILQHHERPDGSGYPHGLEGDDISAPAKICAIADTFDALNTKRPFKDRHTTFEALSVIKREMLRHFDWDLFSDLVRILARPDVADTMKSVS